MNPRPFSLAFWIAMSAVALAQVGCAYKAGSAIDSGRSTVTTENGSVKGLAKGDAEVYLGLPFAAPPMGSLRWAPPERAASWQGVRDGTVAGPSCPQRAASPVIGRTENEDCLYLNLYRPAGAASGASLPVLVYVHGGANTVGGAVQIDGARMAAENGVVVVAINHRLGSLGFLNHPALAQQAKDRLAGNYALLDIKAALEWVQRNIRAFGGNPNKVTLGGTSSGGTNVCAVLVNPGTAGLIHAAIISSDDCLRDVDTVAQSEARAAAFAAKLGCASPENVVTCLRSKSVGELVTAGGAWNPHVDPKGFHRKPAIDAIAAGEWRAVPVLMGSTREEGRSSGTAFANFTAQAYAAWVTRLVGAERAPAMLAAYPADKYSGQFALPYVIGDFITDSGMRGLGGCTNLALARYLARQTPTYYYQFEDPNPPAGSTPPGYEFRASHGLDTPFTWPDSPHMAQFSSSRFTEAQWQLSKGMNRYWAAFVKNFNPEVPGQAAWPRLTADGSLMSLRPGGQSQATPVAQFAELHKCALWEKMPWVLDRGER
ncbi:carboxylesterase/lipase family protein [Polaromonas sp.]|uniref:carboxylesterase/lipase family protein n=1 Tax=Polaromonas sp. TaxID=1869339 RepID=UPI002FC83490